MKNYLLSKFFLALIFSTISYDVLANITQPQHKPIDITIIQDDYLFMIFLFFGLTISLIHDYINDKKNPDKRYYKFGVLLVILAIVITVITTLLVWALYQSNAIPEKMYYGVVLFSSVFSNGIVRFLLGALPERIGKSILKFSDKLGNIKISVNTESDANNNQYNDEI